MQPDWESPSLQRGEDVNHRSVRATQCPSLIFGTEPEFQQWVMRNF
jgi:hypothetical protein